MTDRLTFEISNRDVTSADDRELGRVLEDSLNEMDADRQRFAYYESYDEESLKDRVARLEATVLVLATIVSRRIPL